MTMMNPPPGREILARGAETMSRVIDQARTLADVAGRHAAEPAARPPPPPAAAAAPCRTRSTLRQDADGIRGRCRAARASCSGTPCARPATPSSSTRRRAARRCWSSSGRWWWTAAPCRGPATTPWSASRRRPARRADRPEAAPLRHHRSARRPRRRHRRLQVRQPGRRRAAPRPSGLLRDLLPRPGARPDHPRHHRGRDAPSCAASTRRTRTRRSPSSSATARAAGR